MTAQQWLEQKRREAEAAVREAQVAYLVVTDGGWFK